MEVEVENVYDNFHKNKEMYPFSYYSAKSKYYDSDVLVVGKMNSEIGGIANKEFDGLKPKMHFILVSESSKYKKVKGVNKIIVAKMGCNEYKDVKMFDIE